MPNSVPLTVSAGITLGQEEGFFGALRARYFSARPLEESGAHKAKASLTLNARAGYRKNDWEVAVDCLNLLDTHTNDIEYYYESRLSTESAAVEDHHLHPMEPRTFRVMFTRRW